MKSTLSSPQLFKINFLSKIKKLFTRKKVRKKSIENNENMRKNVKYLILCFYLEIESIISQQEVSFSNKCKYFLRKDRIVKNTAP